MSHALLIKTMVSIVCLSAAGSGAVFLLKYKAASFSQEERFAAWLTAVLPFAYGGYYSISAAVTSGLLLLQLLRVNRKNGGLHIYLNLSALAFMFMTVAYSLSVLWAADRGMACYGIAKALPILLYAALLMQLEACQPERLLVLVPYSGTLMTVLALGLQFVPELAGSQAGEDGIAGFFEYSNTLALYLMLGIAVLMLSGGDSEEGDSARCRKQRGWKTGTLFMLLYGVLSTGSRIGTALLLLELLLIIICLLQRKCEKDCVRLCAVLLSAVLLFLLTKRLTAAAEATGSSGGIGSLLCRLLYAKDALRLILRHPFGLGFWGFAAVQKSYQHAVYSVSFVHNDFLQRLLDIGWLPTILLYGAFAVSFFRRAAGALRRLLLFLIIGYGMFEFHLEYLAIWLILLPTLQLQTGRQVLVPAAVPGAVSACLLAFSLWLGTGEALYVAGFSDCSHRMMPLDSRVAVRLLSHYDENDDKRQLAEQLLSRNPTCAEAWLALAQLEADDGTAAELVRCSQQVMACSRYQLKHYETCFDLLYARLQQAEADGAAADAALLRNTLQEIPDTLQTVLDSTDPLAWEIEHSPQLELPQQYQRLLQELAEE